MSLAIVFSRAQLGIESPLVTVEVHLSRGLPSLSMVGLAETAVKESKDRVRSAIINNGFEFPLKRITINLGPADLPKSGGRYDLAIAIGILAASEQIPRDNIDTMEFLGELALSGDLRAVKGTLPAAMATQRDQRCLVLPSASQQEASLVSGLRAYHARHLCQVCASLFGTETLPLVKTVCQLPKVKTEKDLSDVRQQHQAKRALEIAAAGGHSLLMIGPPGTGKSMLAERIVSILPALPRAEALEAAAVASISHQGLDPDELGVPPFRAPHHSASAAALVGGGSHPKPGEISLAHHGVLFLDELPEFSRQVLEVLREPLESRQIVISRAGRQATFPANFQLLAAMNPCPCGYLGDNSERCQCTEAQIQRYRHRLSGPLLDRIDLQVFVANLGADILASPRQEKIETSDTVRQRVAAARALQRSRASCLNADLHSQHLEQTAALDNELTHFLCQTIEQLQLSSRALHRILRVARTIADLDGEKDIGRAQLAEAVNYRCLDRNSS